MKTTIAYSFCPALGLWIQKYKAGQKQYYGYELHNLQMGNVNVNTKKRSATEMESEVTADETVVIQDAVDNAIIEDTVENSPAFIATEEQATLQDMVALDAAEDVAELAPMQVMVEDLNPGTATEEPLTIGSAVYLLTFLGFASWLVTESYGNISYAKTACTRLADFLAFVGNLQLPSEIWT